MASLLDRTEVPGPPIVIEDDVQVGMRAQVQFDDVTPEVTLVTFRPAS